MMELNLFIGIIFWKFRRVEMIKKKKSFSAILSKYLTVSHGNTVISNPQTGWLFFEYLFWVPLPWNWNFSMSLTENEHVHLGLWAPSWEGLMISIPDCPIAW